MISLSKVPITVHDVVILALLCRHSQLSIEQFTTECETAGLIICTPKSRDMLHSQKRVEFSLWVNRENPTPIGGAQVAHGLVHERVLIEQEIGLDQCEP